MIVVMILKPLSAQQAILSFRLHFLEVLLLTLSVIVIEAVTMLHTFADF
jgi:hypothetical protein